MLRRWQKPGDVTDVPRATIAGSMLNTDRYLSLNLPYNVKTLKVSYVGYKTQELPIQPSMAITMSDSGTALDEVMVVAYGTAKKTSYTGSAEAVTNKKLELRPVTDATKALEGNVVDCLAKPDPQKTGLMLSCCCVNSLSSLILTER